jgi:hypothetical protein
MSKLTDLLNQIAGWIQQHNPEEWDNIRLDRKLSCDEIQSLCEGKSFVFPSEIVELYQWHNGSESGSFFLDAQGVYGDQQFYSLDLGLGYGEDWSQEYCPGKKILLLFSFEDAYWWTVLPDKPQEFAPIYISDEPDFDTASPNYPSLSAMLEKEISRLKIS